MKRANYPTPDTRTPTPVLFAVTFRHFPRHLGEFCAHLLRGKHFRRTAVGQNPPVQFVAAAQLHRADEGAVGHRFHCKELLAPRADDGAGHFRGKSAV